MQPSNQIGADKSLSDKSCFSTLLHKDKLQKQNPPLAFFHHCFEFLEHAVYLCLFKKKSQV